MASNTVLVTTITSSLGFILNVAVISLVLSRGRKKYHYLFAGIPLMLAIWDIGIVLCMIRNSFTNELPVYGYVISLPCVFLPALIYHFTCAYLNQPRKKSTIFIWVFCIIGFVLNASGIGGKIMGVYDYSWGNIFRPDSASLLGTASWLLVFYIFVWSSCWFLLRAYRRESSPIARRHIFYILFGFFLVFFAHGE